MNTTTPLILTLRLDERSFAFFDEQRRRYFPRERNFIPAHLTLFHHLPGEHIPVIQRDIEVYASEQQPFAIDVTGLRSLGRGVAYTLRSPALSETRRDLALRWIDWLKPQDRQNHNPHVTVQNKVDPTQARALLEDLSESFQPFLAQGVALDLWWYRGGPWEMVRTFGFKAPSSLSRLGEGQE